MIKRIFYTCLFLVVVKSIYAQNVGVNTTGAAPDNSAMLDVSATNKGLLIPRVALTGTNDVTTITSPATSLMVYNTATAGTAPNNVTPGYYYWGGSAWIRVATDGDSWKTIGNAGTNPSTNFLGTTDANEFQIRVNNISKIHIRNDAAGTNRVGIGTNFATVYTPSATPTLLHVHDGETGVNDFALITLGSSKSTATNKLGELHFAATGVASTDRRTAGFESFLTAVTAGPNVSGDLRFFTNNSGNYTEKVRIQPNGRVGIGTTTPAGQLDVVLATNNPTALFTNYGNVNEVYLQRAQGTLTSPTLIGSNGVLGRIRALGYDGANFQPAAQIAFEVDATSGSGDMPGRIVFSTTPDGTTTLTERMRIVNNGNVGIGTTNPGSILSISSSTSLDGIFQTDGTRWIRYMPGTVGSGSFNNITQANDNAIIFSGGTQGTGNLVIAPWGNTGVTSGIRITSAGNVGIGVTNPSSKLHLNDFSDDCQLTIQANLNPDGIQGATRINLVGSQQTWTMYHADPDGYYGVDPRNFEIWEYPSNPGGSAQCCRRRFIIESTWGMLTGGGPINLILQNNGNVCTYGAFVTCSDKRYKINVTPIESALSKIKKIEGVYFKWDTNKFPDKHFSDKKQIGFIAQEIESEFPELVSEDKDGYKTVDYSKMTAVLVNAIKEQQSVIESLQKQIAEKDNAYKELINKQQDLENQVSILVSQIKPLLESQNTTLNNKQK